jgi:hypothetical protein
VASQDPGAASAEIPDGERSGLVDYVTLLDLGFSFLQMFLGKLSSKLPAEVAAAVQKAMDAIAAHRDDQITKLNLEAERG